MNDSPIDGKPCDELECGPCVVFVVQRPALVLHNRLIAVDTWLNGYENVVLNKLNIYME